MAAVMSMKGESDQLNVSDAVAMIHATPASDRSRFAREIWQVRREHGTTGKASGTSIDEFPSEAKYVTKPRQNLDQSKSQQSIQSAANGMLQRTSKGGLRCFERQGKQRRP
jgi:hypothetical protein